jgi:hypothetical protein
MTCSVWSSRHWLLDHLPALRTGREYYEGTWKLDDLKKIE